MKKPFYRDLLVVLVPTIFIGGLAESACLKHIPPKHCPLCTSSPIFIRVFTTGRVKTFNSWKRDNEYYLQFYFKFHHHHFYCHTIQLHPFKKGYTSSHDHADTPPDNFPDLIAPVRRRIYYKRLASSKLEEEVRIKEEVKPQKSLLKKILRIP